MATGQPILGFIFSGLGIIHIPSLNLCQTMKHPNTKPEKSPRRQGSYWLYGIHAVKSALANGKRKVLRAVATQQSADKIRLECKQRNVTLNIVSPQDIAKLLPQGAVHQGVALDLVPLAEMSLENYIAQAGAQKPVVLLDQVTDPHNVGAILRSAAAFGAGAVIVTKDNAPQESAIIAKASSGGVEIVPLIPVTNLSQSMETLKKAGFWCVGLDGEAKQDIAKAKLDHKTALVLGAEGAGLRRLTAERCDLLVRLPISPQMESLNVSNAAAVALYALTQGK